MLLHKLHAHAIGPLWAKRTQATKPECCSVCGQPRWQFTHMSPAVVAIIAQPITDLTPQKLLKNCLYAGWGEQVSVMVLHTQCSADENTMALQQITTLSPKHMVVFGLEAAHYLDASFNFSQRYSYKNLPLIVTHHPDAMLTHPELKAQTWADFCLIQLAPTDV